VLFLLVFACETGPAIQDSGALTVLTYNVHGLPSAITGDDTLARLSQIGPLLDTYDLVAIQEDFMEEGHQLLDDGTRLPFETRFSDLVDPNRVYGSGLSTFGVHPVLQEEGVHFSACYGLSGNSSDCLATKGFQIISLELDPGLPLYLVNTHLEAGADLGDQTARESNVNELIEVLSGLDLESPLIFLGDTNLHPEDAIDGPLSARFELEFGLEDVCSILDCPEPNRIDRIYVRNGYGATLEPVKWNVAEELVDADGLDLSDHNGIVAEIQWARTGQSD
jgi:endonuclease/exonuclease/phosphatase family metal-dependent hydrolase